MCPTAANTPVSVRVILDGKPLAAAISGTDVVDGILRVDSDRLYRVVDLKGNRGEHTLELRFSDGGVGLFTFTFG